MFSGPPDRIPQKLGFYLRPQFSMMAFAAAIETLRAESMKMADQASLQLVSALSEAAQVLTVEQRLELIEFADRFHPRR